MNAMSSRLSFNKKAARNYFDDDEEEEFAQILSSDSNKVALDGPDDEEIDPLDAFMCVMVS